MRSNDKPQRSGSMVVKTVLKVANFAESEKLLIKNL